MYPEFHSQELIERVDYFILNAEAQDLFHIHKSLFDFLTPYLLNDDRTAALLCGFSGKRLGLSVGRDFHSTLLFKKNGFDVLWGISRSCPVFEIVSREAYRDGVLHRVDPVKLIILRKVRVKHLPMLARWALPHWHLLVDLSFFQKLLSHQDEVESWMSSELTELGY
ncbi:MAG: hypothetical protein A2W01_10145 [Candidatus Solincola sediminis]|uniref:Uncharacterized protein n=1 Tax=Candidatus Solincola sediminis TaxID=1797199 RepID=A0A1F2WGV1_9ACTN|nr:MAG: hypothetical protein A2Y75_00790 [Candidatus Solincola sediminis]OFW56624.1 MAG: hypothetical protein A2W01_10145 [Candidatus Solincola sediminis]